MLLPRILRSLPGSPSRWGITILTTLACLSAPLQNQSAGRESAAPAAGVASDTLPPDIGTRRTGTDWASFLGPTRDSKSTERGIRTDWSSQPLPIIWDYQLAESYGTCTVSRGRVFQFDRQQGQGVLLCLNSETGKQLWQYTYNYQYRDQYGYNNGPRCSPIVDEGRVYIFGVDGMLICIDVTTGKQIWRVDTAKQFGVIQNFFGVGANPIVVEDKLIVMVGGSPQQTRLDQAKGNGSGIVAFDKRTGEVIYQLSDELASYASLQWVQRNERAWAFAFLRGGLLAFDPNSGKEDFHFPWRARVLESVNASVPVVMGDHLFISETYGPGSALINYVASGGSDDVNVVWQDKRRSRMKRMQTHWNTAVHHEGYLYGSSGRHLQNAELRCINALTGEVAWSQPGLQRCSLLYVDGHLVCLSENGRLRLLRATPERYDLVSEAQLTRDGRALLKPPAWAAPVLAHGLLYLRGGDRLVCVELIPDSP